MKKGQLKALFIEAKGTGQKYIGVMIQTEGSSEPEVIINPKENFNAKFDYYMAAYDDDLILIAAKGNKDIRITGAAAGASFEDIQSQLIDEKASSGWKEQIADAVDRVVDKMLKETPPETEEERQNCETMRETIKRVEVRFVVLECEQPCDEREHEHRGEPILSNYGAFNQKHTFFLHRRVLKYT